MHTSIVSIASLRQVMECHPYLLAGRGQSLLRGVRIMIIIVIVAELLLAMHSIQVDGDADRGDAKFLSVTLD